MQIEYKAWLPEDHWWIKQHNERMVDEYSGSILFECEGFHEEEIDYLQYLDFKDINDKRVCQADILKCYKRCDEYDFNSCRVDNKEDLYHGWTEGWGYCVVSINRMGFYLRLIKGSQWFFGDPTGCGFTLDCYPEEEHFEIIGNIYEHPEILEELKKSAEDKK